MKYILSIDQSTSATKAVLFDELARQKGFSTIAHRQFYPQSGWVEHDPEEIFNNTLKVIRKVVSDTGIDPDEILSIAITNQRETVIVWDKNTGRPAYNAVVWQCQRGLSICNQLKEDNWGPVIKQKTGLIIDPYFSASGIKWILDHVEGAREKAVDGNLLFGTMDCWLIWKLSGGKVHATDYSNACRTMLFNIYDLTWDREILELLGIPQSMCPVVKFSDEIYCETKADFFKSPVPVSGIMGDSHAALFGQNCFEPGMAKATYGTGSSIMINIGEKPQDSPEGLVTSIGYAAKNKVFYVFEGNIHCTGCTIKWLIDDLKMIDNASETETLAESIEDTEGVYLVPAFVGLGAPYWNNQARALITGMNRGTNRAHIVRAALEAIAYQVKDLLDLMTADTGINLKELRVDGGPTKNKFLMQFQADILNTAINISNISEASALGVALMAGLGTGLWKDYTELKSLRSTNDVINGGMASEIRESLYDGWKKAVKKVFD